MAKNPLIYPPNIFDEYNKSIKDLRNNPQSIEFDKLCYLVFNQNEDGKKLLEILEKKFLKSRLAHLNSANYEIACVRAECMREVILGFMESIESYVQRVQNNGDK